MLLYILKYATVSFTKRFLSFLHNTMSFHNTTIALRFAVDHLQTICLRGFHSIIIWMADSSSISDLLIFSLVPCTALYCTVLYCTALYCTVLHCTVLYCTALYYTALYYTVLHYTVLQCTVLYCTASLVSGWELLYTSAYHHMNISPPTRTYIHNYTRAVHGPTYSASARVCWDSVPADGGRMPGPGLQHLAGLICRCFYSVVVAIIWTSPLSSSASSSPSSFWSFRYFTTTHSLSFLLLPQ
jgi:hypothetical protein